jgi:hypothetical protein
MSKEALIKAMVGLRNKEPQKNHTFWNTQPVPKLGPELSLQLFVKLECSVFNNHSLTVQVRSRWSMERLKPRLFQM